MPNTTLVVDHCLSISELVTGRKLERIFSAAIGAKVEMRESTDEEALDESELIALLQEPSWIQYSPQIELNWDVWLTKRSVAVEFMQSDFEWPLKLLEQKSFLNFQALVRNIARAFNSPLAIVAPSCGPGSGAATEFFAEAIGVQELLERLRDLSGPPLGVFNEAVQLLPITNSNIDYGYLVFDERDYAKGASKTP